MAVIQGKAKLADKRQLNEKFFFFDFEMVEPHRLDFAAGQYVSIAIPGETGTRRAYSITSSPEKNSGFELLVDVSPQGVGSKYLQNMEPGTEINFLAPMGVFTLVQGEKAEKEKAIIFVATGSGIAPFRSMVQYLLQFQNDQRPIWLYWGMRYVTDMFWQDEFHELAQAFPNFHFHITLSRAPEDWPLCRGRVTDCLSIHDLPADAGYYLCGNRAMIEDVSNVLMGRSIPKEAIHFEKFY